MLNVIFNHSHLSKNAMMRILRIIVLTIFFLSLTSCNNIKKIDTESLSDYNTTSFSWLGNSTIFAECGEGLYSLLGNYIFFTDYKTMKTVPLCSQAQCLHFKEEIPEKIPNCNAFIIAPITQYLGYSDRKIVCVQAELTTGMPKTMFSEDADGSHRKVVLDSLSHADTINMKLHRGLLFFSIEEVSLDGDKGYGLCMKDMRSDEEDYRVLYKNNADGGRISAILPLDDCVYFTDMQLGEIAGNVKYDSKLYCYHISSDEIECISEEDYFIYGAYEGNLVLRKDWVYYDYTVDNGEISETKLAINKFCKEHENWQCHPELIEKDFIAYTCYDLSNNEFVRDLIITNRNGDLCAELEDAAWSSKEMMLITIDGEKYFLKTTKSYMPFSLQLYKKEDLLDGKINPIELYSVNDYDELTPAFIIYE